MPVFYWYTLKTMEKMPPNITEYIKYAPREVEGDLKTWIDIILTCVGPKDSILEIGSGTGRDADYIENLGYRVFRTDNSPDFIGYQQNLGKIVTRLDILKDTPEKFFSLVYANAVFLHFNTDEFTEVIQKIKSFISSGGFLAFSLKTQGENDVTYDKNKHPLYFQYWKEEEIEKLMKKLGFELKFKLHSKINWLYFIFKLPMK